MLKSGMSVWHAIALAVAVLLEGLALLSVLLNITLAPLGSIYPNVISVAVYLLPTAVGFIARHLQSAVFLAMLPFWALVLIYAVVYSPVYGADLFQLGTVVRNVGFALLVLGLLGLFGWLLRRMTIDRLVGARQAIRTTTPVTVG